MKKRKLEKKRKARGITYEDIEEMAQAQQEERAFLKKDVVSFGERNDAPPDLRGLPRMLPKKPTAGAAQAAGQQHRPKEKKMRKDAGATTRSNEGKKLTAEQEKWARLREEAQQAYRAMKTKQHQDRKST